jgi:hypothetical protein
MKTDAEGTVFEKIEQCLERSVFLPWLLLGAAFFLPSRAIGSERTVLTKTGEVPRDLALSKVCPRAKTSKFY